MGKLSHRDIKKLSRANRWKIQDLDTRSLLVGMITLTTKLWEENGKQWPHYSADQSLKWHALRRLQSFRIITLNIHDNPVRQGFLSPFYTQGNGSTGSNDSQEQTRVLGSSSYTTLFLKCFENDARHKIRESSDSCLAFMVDLCTHLLLPGF